MSLSEIPIPVVKYQVEKQRVLETHGTDRPVYINAVTRRQVLRTLKNDNQWLWSSRGFCLPAKFGGRGVSFNVTAKIEAAWDDIIAAPFTKLSTIQEESDESSEELHEASRRDLERHQQLWARIANPPE